MATTVCSKTIALKIWDAAAAPAQTFDVSTSGASNGPVDLNGGVALPIGRYELVAADPAGIDAYVFTVDDDIILPPPGFYVASKGGGGECSDVPAITLSPIGEVPGWNSTNTSVAAAQAAAQAGIVALNPLMEFDLLAATVLSVSKPAIGATACNTIIRGNAGGTGVRLTITRIGQE